MAETKSKERKDSSDDSALSFEKAMDSLNALVEKLEQGDLGLEESVKLYEKGMKLQRLCEKRLREAEMKVEKLATEGGTVTGSTAYSRSKK